jgi:hypothetical protein
MLDPQLVCWLDYRLSDVAQVVFVRKRVVRSSARTTITDAQREGSAGCR